MCGIVGAIANRNVSVVDILINGLKKLEYRGYDSAGLAIIDENGTLKRLRVVGKVKALIDMLDKNPFQGHLGIAHTRWATHGAPSEKNAHPFTSHDIFSLVHNGIIENHHELRDVLSRDGYVFTSDTDTEVVVHLLHRAFQSSKDLITAVRQTMQQIHGAYALGIISKLHPDTLIGVRRGSPLVVGKGTSANYIASDPLALLSVTQQFIYLEDDDIVALTKDDIKIYDVKNKQVSREIHTLAIQQNDVMDRGEYRHFMKKEIMEQANALNACLEGRLSNTHCLPSVFGSSAEKILPNVKHVQLVACGTSYHAAMVARYWIESLAGISCSVEVASEFRYRTVAAPKNSLFIALSQSGETADTLAALRMAKNMGYLGTLAICNVADSTMTRESEMHFLTRAGLEIGVASTKAFLTQLASLFLLTLALAKTQKKLSEQEEVTLVEAIKELPNVIRIVLGQDQAIMAWAKQFTHKEHAIFLGRGALFPIALEGALKMKEISYIHAEGYPSGELKHGPLALVDKNMPVIATAPSDALLPKTLSNLQEIHARGGQLFILTDQKNLHEQDAFSAASVILMPPVHPLLAPILYTVPLQLLAYHVAVMKGTDVDQPRNLAKSVTVE